MGCSKPEILEKVREIIKKKFPKVDLKNLGPVGFSRKSGNETEIVSFGPKGGEYAIFKKGSEDLLESFTKKSRIKDDLGPKAEDIIDKDNASVREERQRLREAEKQLKESERNAFQFQRTIDDLQDLRNKIQETQAKIDALEKEQGSDIEVKTNCQD